MFFTFMPNMRKVLFIVIAVLLVTSCHTVAKNQSQSLQQIPDILLGSFTDDYSIPYRITEKEWMQDKIPVAYVQ